MKNKLTNTKNDMLKLFIVFLLSSVFFLFNDSLFWDDWVWTGGKFIDYFHFSSLLGNGFFGGIILFIAYSLPVLLVRFIIVLLVFIQGLCLYKIIKLYSTVSQFALHITCLYLLFPFNPSIYSVCVFMYIVCVSSFFIASLLFIRFNHDKSSKFYSVVSLLLFFISFHTSSLLFFYIVPFMFVAYSGYRVENKLNINLYNFVKKNILFILLPFVFFCFKLLFMQPQGLYAATEYNKIDFKNILKMPYFFLYTFYNLIRFLNINASEILSSFFVILILLIYIVFVKIKCITLDKSIKIKLFLFSLFCIIAALFPYFIVGKAPDPYTWNSRHAFLLPLGIAILVFIFIYIADKKSILLIEFLFSFFAVIFFLSMINTGIKAFNENLKKDAFVEFARKSDILMNIEVFYVDDKNKSDLFMGPWAFYECSGLLWKAYNTRNHLGMDIDHDLNDFKACFEIRYELPYKCENVSNYIPTHIVSIDRMDYKSKDFLKLILYKFINRNKYYDLLSKVYTFQIKSI